MPSNDNAYIGSSYSSRSSSVASGKKFPAQPSYQPTYTSPNATTSRAQMATVIHNDSTKYPVDSDIRSKYQDSRYIP